MTALLSERLRLGRLYQWQRQIGVYARIANGGRSNQRRASRTTRWAYASRRTSSHSVCACRVTVLAITTLQASRHGRKAQGTPLQLRSRNAEQEKHARASSSPASSSARRLNVCPLALGMSRSGIPAPLSVPCIESHQ